jgi:small subunit ribosomal protein S8
MMTDPIADMLTRIRNAVRARKREVAIYPKSKMKVAILEVFKREGFIEGFEVEDGVKGGITVKLKYTPDGESVITDLERISKPSRRIYVGKREIPWVRNGLGIAVLSTSKGILSDREARKSGVGGELLLYVW